MTQMNWPPPHWPFESKMELLSVEIVLHPPHPPAPAPHFVPCPANATMFGIHFLALLESQWADYLDLRSIRMDWHSQGEIAEAMASMDDYPKDGQIIYN